MTSPAAAHFRRVTRADFPLLASWLAQPHNRRWWNHETDPESIEKDFGAAADGREPGEDHLGLVDGVPVALFQRARWHDYPEYVQEITPILSVGPDAATIDYLIGDQTQTGRGLGPLLIAAYTEKLFVDMPDITEIVVPIVAANRRSWRAIERAGYTRVAEGDLEPDNPIDDPAHVVYRRRR